MIGIHNLILMEYNTTVGINKLFKYRYNSFKMDMIIYIIYENIKIKIIS